MCSFQRILHDKCLDCQQMLCRRIVIRPRALVTVVVLYLIQTWLFFDNFLSQCKLIQAVKQVVSYGNLDFAAGHRTLFQHMVVTIHG